MDSITNRVGENWVAANAEISLSSYTFLANPNLSGVAAFTPSIDTIALISSAKVRQTESDQSTLSNTD